MGRLAVSELTTLRWSFDEDVRYYKEAGFDGIGVWRHKLSDFGDEKGAELLAEVGLPVTSLLWVGGFTGNDGRTFRESVCDSIRALQLANFLGASSVVVHSGPRGGHTRNHSRRLLLEALKAMLPWAEEFGITLALEPMPRCCASQWTFLTSLEEGQSVIDSIGSDWIKLVFDTYYFGHDAGVIASLPALVPYLSMVHLADASERPVAEQRRRRLGHGTLPLASIVATLHDSGFDGDYELELMGEELELVEYRDLLVEERESFRSLWNGAVAAPSERV